VLIDFGGVRAAWQPPAAAGATVVGTFGYMAPEQFAGHAKPTSDLYALGATLLHLVTGHPPSDFPYDAGRIEIPHDLPTDSALAGLIEALLRPAPRDRPGTARAARDLLMNPAVPKAGQIVTPRSMLPGSPAVAVPSNSAFGESGEPRFVNMGNPPRDPRGEFSDVYRNLMHPLFPARRAWSDFEHLLWIGFSGAASIVTLGGAPALYAWLLRKRRKKYDHLFRHGLLATGTIRSIPDQFSAFTMVKYQFDVGEISLLGYMQQPREMARYWSVLDTVPVLYDAEDPSASCIVHR
jgi:serine/threonine protein kinase